ncbi:ABC transporter substrate-binding protein [Poseidonocella sp. HB161398]|uniref:ABC transporter substrate-binding protein n=1 Tax=Poseidonocella sp. HB161398 TaxID=2320855 RepID=UPI001109EA5F|nr:ABC transporter substrate-binding protein [Poseidonocella sp. HB161398]
MKRRNFLLATTCLPLAAAIARPVAAATPDDQLAVGFSMANVLTLDPAGSGSKERTQIITNIYDCLLGIDPQDRTRLVPELAESWEVAGDGSAIRLTLREGARFASGNPVTAGDAVWSLRRVLQQNLAQATNFRIRGYSAETAEEDFRALDDRTIELRIPQATDPKIILLTLAITGTGSILDRSTVMEHEVDGDQGRAWLAANSAGSGAYALQAVRANEFALLVRNGNYWGPPPAMKRIILRHVPESQSQRLLLEQGDLDIAYSMAAADLEAVDDDPQIVIETAIGNGLYYLAMSMADPVLADRRVREAILKLVDYDGINAAVMPYYGVEHLCPIQIGLGGETFRSGIARDVDGAKALLAEAGHGDGLDLTLRALSMPPFDNLAVAIQGSLAEGGIRAEIITGDGETVYGAMRRREFQLIVGRSGGQVSHPDGDLRSILVNPDNSAEAKLTGILGWRVSYRNEEINRLAEEALLQPDPDAQAKDYARILELYEADAPPIQPISQVTDSVAMRSDISGLVISPVWQTKLSTVTKMR